MRSLLASCTFLFSAALLAQTPATSTVVIAPPVSGNCPVSLAAQHTRESAMVNVNRRPGPGKQGYQLTLGPAPGLGIVKATITLHGLRGEHILPAAGASDGFDYTESVTITPWTGTDHHFHSVVYTDKLTGVRWIELNELTYADGTQWRESPQQTCRVAPNGFMLVDGK